MYNKSSAQACLLIGNDSHMSDVAHGHYVLNKIFHEIILHSPIELFSPIIGKKEREERRD